MSAVLLPIEQRTPEWYAARREWIGSSDAPVIADESPYKSPFELWAEKTGQRDPEPESEVMATGTLMEPVLRALYERRTGRPVELTPNVYQHPEHPWMVASLDGLDGDAIFEGKWTNAARWREGLPWDVNLQVQHQMAVTGRALAHVAVLRGPTFDILDVPRDESVIADLLTIEADFHERVAARVPPRIDGSESTRRTLASLHPAERLPLVAADEEWESIASQLREAQARAKDWAAREETLKNAARALLGDAAGVEGDGWRITWTKNADSTHVAWEQVALALRRLITESVDRNLLSRGFLDTVEAIESTYTETKPGPRVLRLGGSLR